MIKKKNANQFSSFAQLCPTLCDTWTTAHQASLSITNSRSSLKLMPIESVMPSNHLILCHPLLLLPPIPPSIKVFSNESTLCMRWPKYWSFSFSISPSNEHEFGWTLGVGDGQGGLVCYGSWGRQELNTTEQLNWTELNWTELRGYFARLSFFCKMNINRALRFKWDNICKIPGTLTVAQLLSNILRATFTYFFAIKGEGSNSDR